MRKIINLVAITLLFISCNNTSKKLEMLKEGTFIYERERAFEKKNITVEQSQVEVIRGTKYIVEEKVIYDSLGILQIYNQQNEMYIFSKRNVHFFCRKRQAQPYNNTEYTPCFFINKTLTFYP